jgi:NAD(P)-dependent dehydrogenase (short-subunit alcohol dehydrogenase family)
MDVCRVPEIDAMVKESVRLLGHIDILNNNAEVNVPQWAADVTEEAWDRVMNLNLKGLFFLLSDRWESNNPAEKRQDHQRFLHNGQRGTRTKSSLFAEQSRGQSPDKGFGD